MHTIDNSQTLFFTVVLLIVTAYFFLGSVLLRAQKHDNPVSVKFTRHQQDIPRAAKPPGCRTM